MTNILIVGLGLIGGSLAKALVSFPDAVVYGVDLDEKTLKAALNDKVIIKGYKNADDILDDMDVVFLCLTPEKTVDFINNKKFKDGALVTDVCGVKGYIFENIRNENIDYIGGHPMAGREVGGYESSQKTLYNGANYIVVKQDKNTKEHLDYLESIIKYIGCKHITYTSAGDHDDMIAYTSQLMHVVAATLCDNDALDRAESYSAGSLRDCTRVAKLNPDMWSELFVENKDSLSEQIRIFMY
ncbi:MAG: prephenate dehydrogenase, partial [Clostridia bacterium]|nr:prephenate dehydrogenase [Clostridia bacterium]